MSPNGSVVSPISYANQLYAATFTNSAFANQSSLSFYLVAEWGYVKEATEPEVVRLRDLTHPENWEGGNPRQTHVTARPATRRQTAVLSASFRRYERAGQYRRALGNLDRLRHIRVTNNGWAEAELYASHPRRYEQTGNRMIFHYAGRWRVVSWGTAPAVGTKIPRAVREALTYPATSR